MIVQKLTAENIGAVSGRQICLYEKSLSYLNELCDRFDMLDSISFIVDTNERNQGSFLFRNRVLEVCDISALQQLGPEQTAIVIISDYYREAFQKITDILGEHGPVADIYYFANQETEYEEYYRKIYEKRPLENLIILRSGPHAASYVKGMDFADNARALFEYALAAGINHTYELVWFVKDPMEFERYSTVENVKFLSFDWSVSEDRQERDAYYHVLCVAKYIFFTDAYGFARNCREDQIRVQLWHGCGFKTRVNFVRCEQRYEYTTVISDLYADIHADIYGLRRDQVLVTGYAKEDWLFHPDETDKQRLCIPQAHQYILWLPTFRSTEQKLAQLNEYDLGSETGLPIVGTEDKLERLNELLQKKDVFLIVKLHPFQNRKTVNCGEYSNIRLVENEELVAHDIPVNRLLGMADALISDYSSAAVDYMLMDRPIAFMLEDVEEYEQSRGFVFDNIREWLPGKEIFCFEEICAFVEEVAAGQDKTAGKRRMLRQKMHRFCDDHSCRRILEVLEII